MFGLFGCRGCAGEPDVSTPEQKVPRARPNGSAAHHLIGPVVTKAARAFRLAEGGIGFDDLWFSPDLRSILAPAGGTGCLHLFDTRNLDDRPLCHVARTGSYTGGHGDGTTSADFGAGLLFAADRGSQSLKVIEGKARRITAKAPLAAEPDYVRWVESERELWITEPEQERIEVLKLDALGSPQLAKRPPLVVKGGPESLVIDGRGARAFTHLWRGQTVQIHVATHTIVRTIPNGCQASRGIALEPALGLLFAGCAEGKLVALDSEGTGSIRDVAETPSGVDIIAVNSALHHVYVPAASDGSVTVFGVRPGGKLERLGQFEAQKGAHCAASDDHGRVWVCAPNAGSLLVFEDPFPATVE